MTSPTPNGIDRLINTNENETNSGFHPIVQVVKVSPVNSGANSEQKKRYRVSFNMRLFVCSLLGIGNWKMESYAY